MDEREQLLEDLRPQAFAIAYLMLGSVSRRVIAASKCPVVVLPRGAEHPLRDLIASRGTPPSAEPL